MATDGSQLFVAGDFLSVNNKAQQGVARFSPGPDKTRPGTPAAPVAVSGAPGQMSIYVKAPVDRDDPDLTLRLYRDGGTTPIGTAYVHSLFWRQPIVRFSDPGLRAGSQHTYRVDAIERFGTNKSVLSVATTVRVATSAWARCGGVAATIVGTGGADTIVGTSGADVIVGRGGADTIRGRGGKDIICGGAGRDSVFGGSGRDRIFGNGGNDTLFGGAGRDAIRGGAGIDTCRSPRHAPGCNR
jgi:hypothetical protein